MEVLVSPKLQIEGVVLKGTRKGPLKENEQENSRHPPTNAMLVGGSVLVLIGSIFWLKLLMLLHCFLDSKVQNRPENQTCCLVRKVKQANERRNTKTNKTEVPNRGLRPALVLTWLKRSSKQSAHLLYLYIACHWPQAAFCLCACFINAAVRHKHYSALLCVAIHHTADPLSESLSKTSRNPNLLAIISAQ